MQSLLLLQAFLLVLALSIDALLASFAYGSRKIRIPLKSLLIISFICTGILGLTLLLGTQISGFFNEQVAVWIGFAILFTLGVFRVFDSWFKNWLRKSGDSGGKIRFKIFSIKFILQVYSDPEKADLDGSRTLSIGEAAALAVALSLDALAAGLGVGLTGVVFLPIILIKFFMTAAAVFVGCKLGEKLVSKVHKDLSWLGGALLILLAILQLI